MKTAHDEHFRSADLALVGALLFWFPIESIERQGERAIFVFQNSGELESKVTQFWNGQLKVDALDYFNKLKSVKTRIYQRESTSS